MARSIKIQGEPLAVELYEPAQHRGDALLIHGYTGSKEDFAEVGPLLAARGYRVVAYDNRGQHESAHSQRDDAYTIASLARTPSRWLTSSPSSGRTCSDIRSGAWSPSGPR